MARWRREKRDYSHLGAMSPEQVLERAVERRPFGDTVMRWEYYANRDLIELFGEREEIGIDEVVELYLDMLACRPNAKREEPTPFNYERAGNLIGWGLHLGLLRETPDVSGARAWQLVDREMQYDVHNGRARKIRGLPPGEQAAMDRKRATAAKRAEIAARKYAARVAPEIKMSLDEILRWDPDTVLDARFSEFLAPWFTPPVALREAYGVLVDAHHGWPKERQQHWKRAIGYEACMASTRDTVRRLRAKRLEAEAMSDDDAAALKDLI